mgnify:CR=1 FL=1
MHLRDEYLDKPNADIYNTGAVLRNIDPSLKIHEERISEQCIKFVSEKLGIKPEIVAAAHDFQWKLVKDSVDDYKIVYVNKFFKFRLREYSVMAYIKEMQDQIAELDEKLEGIISAATRRKYENSKKELQEQIIMIQRQYQKCRRSIKNNKKEE